MRLARTTARRGVLARLGMAAIATALAASVAACGSGSGSDGGEGVTIKHGLGETTVEGTPERVVTIGNQWLDATLSLGVTPVGYADNVSVLAGGQKVPWEPDSLSEATVLKQGSDLAEQIAGLEPDLILVPAFLVDQAMYDKLSKLAPTIGPVTEGAQVDLWTDQVTTLGKVLHKEDAAGKVIADVDTKISDVSAKYPNLAGKTFLTCMLTGPSQLMVLADPEDGSSKLFYDLGLSIPQNIVDEAPEGGRLALSPERLGDLTSDILMCGAMPTYEQKFKELPGYNDLPAVKSGGMTFLDTMTISAINTPTALSVPYVLEKLDPTFAAVGK
ncbi:ABC transporter substrate-binding protein [Nocardia cyriacigeorgica]|uniref:ABC transporter substrate-binding protein n=1 Tax=Nocardia cyriacigeorgica TaxID=135487 RepID=A0A6P1D087_9NOCA|nr:ABC transporter substrate-binding protein [Nocardia cyriacigeorgica]NEW39001.1 ABC transporter substrate-binding protein [Nocardia cyriacigeorgica]NEW43865.1 ABC transporter substrate-binding protein [Nocardia cyriacigeorgica]NEW50272.1 ABC transporter substrate-binding protein [Nocardia cyriacigeorgica]NEW54987.1 ABC transporter substrate-binding protein [Nocardia cyriacigeorgica]